MSSVFVANLPQVLLSVSYLISNNLYTRVCLAREWTSFAVVPKTLRVSKPQGQQRKKYFLQLPYRFSVPIMVISTLLHWLISQSIYVAVIEEYQENGTLFNSIGWSTCGFSPIAMIAFLLLLGAIMLSTILLGFLRLPSAMPLAGSSSLAISAACHPPEWDEGASLKPLKWGVVDDGSFHAGVGHCSFTSDVSAGSPVRGRLYAGQRRSTECSWMSYSEL